jgi:ubiquinone biosynthesis protein
MAAVSPRVARIVKVALRYRLDLLVDKANLPWQARTLLKPAALYPAGDLSRGERIRLALEDLGPIFIKLGQMLSTRPDLVAPDIVSELAKLQDNVPPFPSDQALETIETALGAPVGELFAEFSSEALASASIAQVHAATLLDGKEVVVKVVRPGIEAVIRQDIALMYTVARFVERYLPDGPRLRPVEVVDEYKITILDELDLQREAANTSQLKRNFANSELLYIPEVYWDFTRPNVYVMERISGIPVTDVEALNAAGTDMRELAERGVEIFFTQVFRDSFFHADMHPGNIFVDVSDPKKPRYIGIDCAIIGSLDEHDQYYMARNMLAIFQRDYRQVAVLHIECGWIPEDTRVSEFESAIRSVCEPIFEKPLGEISFGQILVYLFTVARRFNMTVQPNLVLLQKTLLNIEGLGRQLYPELDLWATAQPFLERWVEDRYAPGKMAQRLGKMAPSWLEQLPYIPDLLLDNLQQASHSNGLAQVQQQEIIDLKREQKRRSTRSKLAAVLVLGAGIAATQGWITLAAVDPVLLSLAIAALLLLLA